MVSKDELNFSLHTKMSALYAEIFSQSLLPSECKTLQDTSE